MIRLAAALALVAASAVTDAREPSGLHQALAGLEQASRFSGAVVIRGADGVTFARAYGLADPFTGRRFTVDTPVDSGSLAKPMTAAAALDLVRQGRLKLTDPARVHLPEIGHAEITIDHLLSHSAGLTLRSSAGDLAGKSNRDLILAGARSPLLFRPGSAFTYCNLCTVALAEIVERLTQRGLLVFANDRLGMPAGVTWRPARLSDWAGRGIGFRKLLTGQFERADSYEDERFYGPANLSISAGQLAQWGMAWATGGPGVMTNATAPVRIAGRTSGLSLGNWYCAASRARCHYLGHHEGFHHMLYWDARRRVSVAMVSNNSLAPNLQQRLQRALVAYAEGRTASAQQEIASEMGAHAPLPGTYRFSTGETVQIRSNDGTLSIVRDGLAYPAYPIDAAVRYVPGLDAYLTRDRADGLHYLSLYEDLRGRP